MRHILYYGACAIFGYFAAMGAMNVIADPALAVLALAGVSLLFTVMLHAIMFPRPSISVRMTGEKLVRASDIFPNGLDLPEGYTLLSVFDLAHIKDGKANHKYVVILANHETQHIAKGNGESWQAALDQAKTRCE